MKKMTLILIVALMITTAACSDNKAPTNPATPTAEPASTSEQTADLTTPDNNADNLDSTHGDTSEHYYARAWERFLESTGGEAIENARYLFADLDDDGADEMIAYKELRSEDSYTAAPYMTIFDIADGDEIEMPIEIDVSFYYYARIYLNALNNIVIEDDETEGFFSYRICAYDNGVVSYRTDVKNGQEADIEDWEFENKLSRPWDDNPDYPLRFIGLGQLFYEADDSEDSLVHKLIDDSEKMVLYRQP